MEYIISLLPQCIKNVSDEDIKANYFDKFVGNVTVREIIREIIYNNLKSKELEQKKRIINQLLTDNHVTDFLDRNKRKYLKYKQKYLELKKLINSQSKII